MRKPSGIRLLCLAVVLAGAPACLLEEERPRVAIVVGGEASELESLAASELASMLEKLFAVSAAVETAAGEEAQAVILVGRPHSNPLLAEAAGNDWPDLSDQGLLLRSVNGSVPTLLVGGGSPVAVLWAAYDLGERLGVRYLVNRDVFPDRRPWSGLPNLDLVREPNLRIRCWRLVNDLPHGPVSWSLEEYRRFLRQIAKMKYNRIHCALWPAQPFVHYSFRGMEKPPGVLYFGHRHPIGPETIGRERFGSMEVFTNPEFVGRAIRRRNAPASHRTGSRHPEGGQTPGDGDRTVHSALPVAQGVHEGPAGIRNGTAVGGPHGGSRTRPVHAGPGAARHGHHHLSRLRRDLSRHRPRPRGHAGAPELGRTGGQGLPAFDGPLSGGGPGFLRAAPEAGP